MEVLTYPLAYPRDSADLFHPLAAEPWSVFLDSCNGAGRFDIIAARPMTTVVTFGNETVIEHDGNITRTTEDPFDLLRSHLQTETDCSCNPWPFCGGAIGYFGYDLARRIERLPDRHGSTDPFPDMAFGIYPWAVVVDHQEREAALLAKKEMVSEETWKVLKTLFGSALNIREVTKNSAFRAVRKPTGSPRRGDYGEAFRTVQHFIKEGDCYQINLARRYESPAEGNPWSGYRTLRKISPVPYAAFFRPGSGALLSASPERFLTLRGSQVTTSPIKGTRPRHTDPDKDAALVLELCNSAKDRAENLMIVDLLRNDLGRSCRIGSITVDDLFRVETFPTVHHLVSDISGQLAERQDALSLMRNSFPGGSITGAPKLRAMEIIEALEPMRRGPYCGSMAYIGFDGNMDSNILIRTMMHYEDKLWFWAGGGIVADSNEQDEFDETEHKASAMLTTLGAGAVNTDKNG